MKPTQNLIWIVALVTLCTFWSSREVHVQTIEPLQNPFAGNEDAITEGAIFFRSFCWGCHGRKVRGGKAPDLLKPQWLHGWSETGIFETIFNGRPGTRMAKYSGKLTDEEIWKIISYLRMEQAKAAGIPIAEVVQSNKTLVPYMEGNLEVGEQIFYSEEIACSKCHTVRGKGGYGTTGEVGPDLTYVARTRSPRFIMQSILHPRAFIDTEYETITLIMKDGQEITGRKRKLFDRFENENEKAIQVIDESGKLWTTYFKEDIKESFTPKAGMMPENFAQILTVQQLHDLFAYLETLK